MTILWGGTDLSGEDVASRTADPCDSGHFISMTNNDFKHRAQRDMFYELVHQSAKTLSMAQKLSLVMTQTDPTVREHGRIIGDIKTVINDLHTNWAYHKREEENKNNWLLEFLKKKRDEETTPDF